MSELKRQSLWLNVCVEEGPSDFPERPPTCATSDCMAKKEIAYDNSDHRQVTAEKRRGGSAGMGREQVRKSVHIVGRRGGLFPVFRGLPVRGQGAIPPGG